MTALRNDVQGLRSDILRHETRFAAVELRIDRISARIELSDGD